MASSFNPTTVKQLRKETLILADRSASTQLQNKCALDGFQALPDLSCQAIGCLLGIPQEHLRVLLVEDWIVKVRIAPTHGPLAENDLLRPPHLNNGHAPNGTPLHLLCRGIDHIIRTHD